MEVNVKMNDGTERTFKLNPNKKDSETAKFIELLFRMADGDRTESPHDETQN